jgi:hypothetical protein
MSFGIGGLGLRPPSTFQQRDRRPTITRATDDDANGPILKDLETGVGKENSKPGDGVGRFKPKIPKWVTNDRQVMRFWAYHIENPRTPSEKVQKVAIIFYLVDHAIQINLIKDEGDEADFGAPTGPFLKKGVLKKAGGELYEADDFGIGRTMNLHGRKFKIVDCDKNTRSFYEESLKLPQGPPMPYPRLIPRQGGLPQSNERQNQKLKLTPEEAEVNSFFVGGGNRRQKRLNERHSQRPPQKHQANQEKRIPFAKNYMDNTGKVLSFTCYWDDPRAPNDNNLQKNLGERKFFSLQYYLADHKISIRELRPQNSGEKLTSELVKRSLIPKIMDGDCRLEPAGMPCDPSKHYFYTDLLCGSFINVYTRQLQIIDCDSFTRDWYEKEGIKQPPPLSGFGAKLQSKTETIEIPPHTGFGSEQDSLRSVFSVHPKAEFRRTALIKTGVEFDESAQLVFKAKILDSNPLKEERGVGVDLFRGGIGRPFTGGAEIGERDVIFIFHLVDETVSINIPFQKNLGMPSGKFLERAPFPLTTSSASSERATSYCLCRDGVYVGAVFPLPSSKFQSVELLEADNKTVKIMEGSPNLFPKASAKSNCFLSALARAIKEVGISLNDFFGNEPLSWDDSINLIEELQDRQECVSFNKVFTPQLRQSLYRNYCHKEIMDTNQLVVDLIKASALPPQNDTSGRSSRPYTGGLMEAGCNKCDKKSEDLFIRRTVNGRVFEKVSISNKLMQDFGRMIKNKKHVLRKTFERKDRKMSSTIDKDGFSQSIREILGTLTEGDLEIMEEVTQMIFFSSGALRPLWLDYVHFISLLS